MVGLSHITSSMKKQSIFGILLIFIVIMLFVNSFFSRRNKEGFETVDSFTLYEGTDMYDEFYADIYDQLVFNDILNDYEVGSLIQKTTPTSESIILDIGSGTGHDVSSLAKDGYSVTGMDISKAMVAKAKELYPALDFVQGDAMDATRFRPQSFTHILCMYFTVYYMKDMDTFFSNVYDWLRPGGYFVVHLVDRDNFDPIIPPANPLVVLSPQRYAKERITQSKVIFNNFKYKANFQMKIDEDTANFVEKIHFNKGGKRKHEHKMNMPALETVVQMVQDVGFTVHSKVDLVKAGYEYQYLYVFVRPS